MNRLMWANAATQANVTTLRERAITVLGPGDGSQACGEFGPGRMLEPDNLLAALAGTEAGPLAGMRVVVTAGPTREAIDPVRFISNRSSGKMGYAMAAAARAAGAEVVLVSGPTALPSPRGVELVAVETASEMHAAVKKRIAKADVFIATAAVADWTPAETAGRKLKKGAGTPSIEFTHTADILGEVAARKNPPYTVGFAAETDQVRKNALAKLKDKGIDLIAANRVGNGHGFEADENELHVYWDGGEAHFGPAQKSEVAHGLIALIAERAGTR